MPASCSAARSLLEALLARHVEVEGDQHQADRQVVAGQLVVHLDHVGARPRDDGADARELAGRVGGGEREQATAARARQAPLDDAAEQVDVDVPARQHHGDRPARLDGAREQRGDAERASALDDEVGALDQQHHRVLDLRLRDRDDLVGVAADQAERQLRGPGDRRAVGERLHERHGQRRARGERCGDAGHRLRLRADHAHLGPQRLDRERDAGEQSSATRGHDHRLRLGRLFEQLKAELWPVRRPPPGCRRAARTAGRARPRARERARCRPRSSRRAAPPRRRSRASRPAWRGAR